MVEVVSGNAFSTPIPFKCHQVIPIPVPISFNVILAAA